jgi:membrane AbrB-like protein
MARERFRSPINARPTGDPVPLRLTRLPDTLDIPAIAVTVLIGTAGGFAAQAAHLPLPMLLGSMLIVAALALGRAQLKGRPVTFPPALRLGFLPVLGVAIGGAFSPAVLQDMPSWWPSLLAVCVFVPLAHMLSYLAVTRFGSLDRVTAFFGSAPGGLIEAVQMGEERGANVPMLTMLQFLRLILTVVLVPVAFTVMTGHAVGSASGASLSHSALTLHDLPWLIAAGAIGAWLGKRSKLPAGMIAVPMILSSALHAMGVVDGGPPQWLINAGQIAIGTSLGVRFKGIGRGAFVTALRMAMISTGVSLALGGLFAVTFAQIVAKPIGAVFLAFAPGGLTEMSLIALSLNMSVVYVTAHHLIRILLAVVMAQLLAKRVLGAP